MTAERTRIFAVERVTAYDGQRMSCAYTAWGGVLVGTVDGGSWTDGPWPALLLKPR